jgi:hypothetical protein
VDWAKIDRALRRHDRKIKQVLFMDSIVGLEGIRSGEEAYEADLKRLRGYIDMKNASLYSFYAEREFLRPQVEFPCDSYDAFRPVAEGRFRAFEGMYVRLCGQAGGLSLETTPWKSRKNLSPNRRKPRSVNNVSGITATLP